jgi:hypothetical protein
MIARRKTERGSGLGARRWVIERCFAWLHNLPRLPAMSGLHEAELATAAGRRGGGAQTHDVIANSSSA